MGSKLASKNLPHYGVLWQFSRVDTFGENVVSNPIEIRCRWNLSTSITSNNLSKHLVLVGTVQVATQVPVGSILKQCRLADLASEEAYTQGLYEVVAEDVIYDTKGRNPVINLQLSKYHNTLPKLEGTK